MGQGFGLDGVYYNIDWVQADGTRESLNYFDVNGDVNNAVPRGTSFTFASTVPESGTLALLILGTILSSFAIIRRKAFTWQATV